MTDRVNTIFELNARDMQLVKQLKYNTFRRK